MSYVGRISNPSGLTMEKQRAPIYKGEGKMPFKSKAQAGKMFSMEEKGELKPGVAEEFAHATPNIKKLPEHVKSHKSMSHGRHKEHR